MSESATFLATVDAEGRIRVDFPAQQRAYCKARMAGECVELEVRPQSSKRTDRQNKALHALLREWGKDSGNDPDDLKEIMLGIAFGHIEKAMPITGEIRNVLAKPHSSRLNVTEFCHLIEEVLRVAAENGTILQAPEEYRKAKAEEAKRRAA